MASVAAPREGHLPPLQTRAEPSQETETDEPKVRSKLHEEATQHFSVEALKTSSVEEKREVKSVQEEHAIKPVPLPELHPSEAAAIRFPLKSVEPEPFLAEALKSSDAKPSELEIVGFAERKKVAIAPTLDDQNAKFDDKSGASSQDRTFLCESVKEAVTILEERERSMHIQVLEEKKGEAEFDVQKACERLLQYKEKIDSEESYIVNVLGELEKMKEKIRSCKSGVPFVPVGGERSPSLKQSEELLRMNVTKGECADMLHEVELAEEEVKRASERLSELKPLQQSVLKDCEAAVRSHADELMRVKGLLEKRCFVQGFLTALTTALAETEADISLLRSTVGVKLKGSLGAKVAAMAPSIVSLKAVESIISDRDLSPENLTKELSILRGFTVDKSKAEIIAAKVRLEQFKIVEGNRVAALGSSLEQLDEAKSNLKKAMDDGHVLGTKINALQAEISKHQADLEIAHETDQIACATLASLQDELCSIRAKKSSAQMSEANAIEAKRSLPAAIKQLSSEADEAKAASSMAKENARTGRREIEQANASMNTTLKRLQAVQKEAEVIRASEAMALAELKTLSESESEPQKERTICIPFEEYRDLRNIRLESELFATEKVAAILVQVDMARASQQKAQGKLDDILKEIDMMGKAMEDAQKKADDAQAAKLSVEAELRKWRAEHDQWRRTGSNPSSVSTSAAQSPRFANSAAGQGKLVPRSFHHKKAVTHLDGFAELLTLKVPSSEKAASVIPEIVLPQIAGKAKKLPLFTRMVSIILRRKTKTGGIS